MGARLENMRVAEMECRLGYRDWGPVGTQYRRPDDAEPTDDADRSEAVDGVIVDAPDGGVEVLDPDEARERGFGPL